MNNIGELRANGKTLREIAKQFKISHERVRQICVMFGYRKLTRQPKEKIRKEPKEPKDGRIYACEARDYAKETGLKNPVTAYNRQRANARARGIGFNLTFDEWWLLWRDKYHLRGHGMHMCRVLDAGGYEVGNVRIDSAGSNMRERGTVSKMRHCQRAERANSTKRVVSRFDREMSTFGMNPLKIMLYDEGEMV